MTPTGKIARLPNAIREELNRRLHDGQRGRPLLDWLNSLSHTQQLLAVEFGGRPINPVNLTAWRTGGYQVWLAHQEAASLACQKATDLNDAADGKLTSHLATLVATRYAAALVDWDGEVTDDFRRQLRVLRTLCQNVVQLRRGDLTAARMDLDHERLEWQRKETQKSGDLR